MVHASYVNALCHDASGSSRRAKLLSRSHDPRPARGAALRCRPFGFGLAGLCFVLPVSAQGVVRIDATVVASALRADGCPGGGLVALPTGPVTAPVAAQVSGAYASAHGAIQPRTATTPLTIQHDYAAYPPTFTPCPSTRATASLVLDLTLAATPGGPFWLRLLWEEARLAQPEWLIAAGWRVDEPRTNGFHWQESRASFVGRPLYVDIPVDLQQPAPFTVTFSNQAASFWQCGPGGCLLGRAYSTGTLTALVRDTAPLVQEPYGSPCPLASAALPLATAYDPHGVPGRTQVDALLVVTPEPFQFRPVLLCVGASRDSLAGLPLPFDLTPLGAPGCALLQDMVLVLPAVTQTESYAAVPLAPPEALRGLAPLYLQWLVPDAAANPLGVVASNGVLVRVP